MNEWRKERDEAIRSLDLEKFKAFYRKYQKMGLYGLNLPRDEVLEIALRKSLLMMTNATDEEKNRARAWLIEHGYSTEI